MLQIKNNDIYLAKGETCGLVFRAFTESGKPFVIPDVPRKSLLNFAKLKQYENSQIYEFYTPFSIMTPDVDNITMTFYTDKPGAIKLVTVDSDNLLAETEFNVPSDHANIVLDTTKRLLSIECTNCNLRELAWVVNEVYHSYVTEVENTVTSVLAFTVRAADTIHTNDMTSGTNIVFAKYLNMHSGIMQDGETDYIVGGWNKFTSQVPLESDNIEKALELLRSQFADGHIRICKIGNGYYHLSLDIQNMFKIKPYEFSVEIPILHDDTANLVGNEYTYDLVMYQGFIKDLSVFDEDVFPFKKVLYKEELVSPHKFVLEVSNNA